MKSIFTTFYAFVSDKETELSMNFASEQEAIKFRDIIRDSPEIYYAYTLRTTLYEKYENWMIDYINGK